MADYSAPYWLFANLFWVATGIWYALRPQSLVDFYGWAARSAQSTVVGSDDTRPRFTSGIARAGGVACMLVGVVGTATAQDPAVVTSAAVLILSCSIALYRQGDGKRLDYATFTYIAAPLLIAAAALIALRTERAFLVAASTLLVAVALWTCTPARGNYARARDGGTLSAGDERRSDRFAAIVAMSPLPLTVWMLTTLATPTKLTPSLIVACILAEIPLSAQVPFLITSVKRHARRQRGSAAIS